MALTTVNPGSVEQKWSRKAHKDYLRQSGFAPYFGTGENTLFQTNKALKPGGETITFSLIKDLQTLGTGTAQLEGNEEELKNYSFKAQPVWKRNATGVKKSEQHKSAIDLQNAMQPRLSRWAGINLMRTQTIEALCSVKSDLNYVDEETGRQQNRAFYDPSTPAADLNAYTVNNPDRVLFGDSRNNIAEGDWAASLASVTASMKLNADTLRTVREMARDSDWRNGIEQMRPNVVGEYGQETYVFFVTPEGMKQVMLDQEVRDFHKDALNRGMNKNPYFVRGDIMYNDLIIREIPEMSRQVEPYLADKGASSAPLSVGFLCGAQALVYAVGQEPIPTKSDNTDYGFIEKVGIECLHCIAKTFYDDGDGGPQRAYGVLPVFHSK